MAYSDRSNLPLLRAFVLLLSVAPTALSSLSPNYYDSTCPAALPAIRHVVEAAVRREGRTAAFLLRLHFHDCFVQGCDGSVLLDPSPSIDSEKLAIPNNNSLGGFDVVDQIKAEVDRACGKPVVSCADILAVAARDSVVALGGKSWDVLLGRKDSTTANRTLANIDIPPPFLDLPALVNNFANQGLDEKDLVVLSGGHTLGFSRCLSFRNRTYNDTNIAPGFADHLRATCPPVSGDGDSNLEHLDETPFRFDTNYFGGLVGLGGLLHSDQALFSGGSGFTDELVRRYRHDFEGFSSDFGESMIKMGNIKVLTGDQGQIRINCRVVNQC